GKKRLIVYQYIGLSISSSERVEVDADQKDKTSVQQRTFYPGRYRINRIVGRDDHISVAGKTQPDDVISGDKGFGIEAVPRDPYDTVPSGIARSNIKIAESIEGESLRTPESSKILFVKSGVVDDVNRVVARKSRRRNE